MGLNRYQIFGWEMIANVRRWATCAANSSLKLMRKIFNMYTVMGHKSKCVPKLKSGNSKLAQL